jgi:hypothetical protein
MEFVIILFNIHCVSQDKKHFTTYLYLSFENCFDSSDNYIHKETRPEDDPLRVETCSFYKSYNKTNVDTVVSILFHFYCVD